MFWFGIDLENTII